MKAFLNIIMPKTLPKSAKIDTLDLLKLWAFLVKCVLDMFEKPGRVLYALESYQKEFWKKKNSNESICWIPIYILSITMYVPW